MSNLGQHTIEKYMVPTLHTIEPMRSLEEARKIMGRYTVRHLPVLSGGRLVGLLAERDLSYLKAMPGIKQEELKVKDAMVYDPLLVSQNESLSEVAQKMAELHIGSVLVCDESKKLVGIFTYIDALKALAAL